MTASTVTQNPARPGPPAPQYVWTLDGNGTELNGGKPMTGLQALNHVRRWTGFGARIHNGKLETWTLDTADLPVSTWSPSWPPATDPHPAIAALIRDCVITPLAPHQAALLDTALRAAADGVDPRPALLQLIATTPAEETP